MCMLLLAYLYAHLHGSTDDTWHKMAAVDLTTMLCHLKSAQITAKQHCLSCYMNKVFYKNILE